MKVRGDIESVNLSTGEQSHRVTGDGESILVKSRGPVDEARLGPRREAVFGPIESEPTVEQIVEYANRILKGVPMLRCKFRVNQIIREGQGRKLALTASNQADGDNKDWSKWTPSGDFSIYVTNVDAFAKIDAMNPGDHFYIDLSPVPAAS